MSKVTIHLTLNQAKLIWSILDGVADAGACEDGLRPDEHKAIWCVIDQINPHILAEQKSRKASAP